MAQSPRTLTPYASPRHFLGAELRYWRQLRGMSVAQLARAIYASADLLCKIEKADRVPSEAVIRCCDNALNAGGTLVRLFGFMEHVAATALPAPLASSQPILIKITAEVAYASNVEAEWEPPATRQGGARLYALPDRRGPAAGGRRRRDASVFGVVGGGAAGEPRRGA